MDRVTLDTDQNPVLKFERINGSLRLKGWDRPSMRTDAEREDTLAVEQSENTTIINCKSGCIARIPMESQLEIGRVDGELMLKSVECEVKAEEVYGNFLAKSVGPVSLNLASGNVNCRGVEGDFNCKTVNGNANFKDVDGKISIDKVKGNVSIKGYSSGIAVETQGNATLRIDPDPEGTFTIKANGNINCRLAASASATVQIISGSELININSESGKETFRESEHSLTLGEGQSKVKLEAKGKVDFSVQTEEQVDWNYEFDIEGDLSAMASDITQIVTDQLETQLGSLNKNLDQITSNLSAIGPRTSEKIEAKRRKLERKIAKVERRAAKRVQKSASRSQRKYKHGKPSSDPVTDEERQKVLEMLQNQLISVQEAEILLATLEGRKPDLPDTEPETAPSEND